MVKSIFLFVLIITLSGCTVNFQSTEKTNSDNISLPSNTTTIEKESSDNSKKMEIIDSDDQELIKGIIKDYIIKNKTFDVTLDNRISEYPEYNEDNVAPTYDVEIIDGHILVYGKSDFPTEVKKMKLLDIYEEDGEIIYNTEYAIYETFVYYKDNFTTENQGYFAYLKYYMNSSGEHYLKLNCYHQYYFYLEYNQEKDVFIDIEEGSKTYGNEIRFKKSLDENIRPAYHNLMEKVDIYEEKLNSLIVYLKTQIV